MLRSATPQLSRPSAQREKLAPGSPGLLSNFPSANVQSDPCRFAKETTTAASLFEPNQRFPPTQRDASRREGCLLTDQRGHSAPLAGSRRCRGVLVMFPSNGALSTIGHGRRLGVVAAQGDLRWRTVEMVTAVAVDMLVADVHIGGLFTGRCPVDQGDVIALLGVEDEPQIQRLQVADVRSVGRQTVFYDDQLQVRVRATQPSSRRNDPRQRGAVAGRSRLHQRIVITRMKAHLRINSTEGSPVALPLHGIKYAKAFRKRVKRQAAATDQPNGAGHPG